MIEDREAETLEELIQQIDRAVTHGERVALDTVLEAIGRRSFGPLLLLPGLITLAPLIGDIPGVPTIMALFVALIAVQLMIGRQRFWLPEWMLRRSIAPERMHKALVWSRRPAHYIDKMLRPRLAPVTDGAGVVIIAAVCLLIALAMPIMEVIPFSANGAGVALTAFGLALISKDGVLALIALAITLTTLGLIGYHLIF